MNKKVTRFFQGLTVTSFLMAGYNTQKGIEARKRLSQIDNTRDESLIKNTESLQRIEDYLKKTFEGLLNHGEKVEKYNEKVETVFNPCLNSLKKTENKWNELLNNSLSDEQLKSGFNELDKLIIESSNHCNTTRSTILEIIKEIEKSGGNSKNNFTIEEISNYLSTLSFEQTVAIFHIFGYIIIIISLISLFTVFYGNKLIDYYQLEQKFPKIARFIQLRRKFQMFYSLLDFSIILIVISIMFYIDLLLFNS